MLGQGQAVHVLLVLLSLGLPWSTGEEHVGKGEVKENAGVQQGHSKPWGYNAKHGQIGPNQWNTLYPDQCGSSRHRQSPIDITTQNALFMEDLKEIDVVFQAPYVSGKDKEASDQVSSYAIQNMTMKNNGHTISIRPKEDIFFVGGELGDVYKVFNIHFHWGANSSQSSGSEHRVDGKQFPLEMHIVAYDSERYGSIMEAIDKYNSLAVLGTFFEVGAENVQLNPIIDRLDQVIQPSTSLEIPWINPSDLLPPETYRYFRYEGSLTTPRCYESVIWTVFNRTNTISQAQLEKFYQLLEVSDGNATVPLYNNWRHPQPLNERPIYTSISPVSPSLVEAYEEEVKDLDLSTNDNNTATTISVAMATITFLAAVSIMAFLP